MSSDKCDDFTAQIGVMFAGVLYTFFNYIPYDKSDVDQFNIIIYPDICVLKA